MENIETSKQNKSKFKMGEYEQTIDGIDRLPSYKTSSLDKDLFVTFIIKNTDKELSRLNKLISLYLYDHRYMKLQNFHRKDMIINDCASYVAFFQTKEK